MTIPPWLGPQTHNAELYARGAGLAQAHAMAQANLSQEAERLQQAKHIAEMELQARSENQNRDHLIKIQQLAIQSAYKQQMIGLNAIGLKQKAEALKLKTDEAANQLINNNELKRRMDSGESLATASSNIPGLFGGNPTSIASFLAATKAPVPRFDPSQWERKTVKIPETPPTEGFPAIPWPGNGLLTPGVPASKGTPGIPGSTTTTYIPRSASGGSQKIVATYDPNAQAIKWLTEGTQDSTNTPDQSTGWMDDSEE